MNRHGDNPAKLTDIPGRVFLDTSVVNFILDYGDQIHDGLPFPEDINDRVKRDIDALYNIFRTGHRAIWQLAISPHTYYEIARTEDPHHRRHLRTWFNEIWQYWRDITNQSKDLPGFPEAEDLRVRLLMSGSVDILPDLSDRVLICDAVVYRCELFCTRDWTTILKHRAHLADLPIEIVTPTEWWVKIRPYAGIWA